MSTPNPPRKYKSPVLRQVHQAGYKNYSLNYGRHRLSPGSFFQRKKKKRTNGWKTANQRTQNNMVYTHTRKKLHIAIERPFAHYKATQKITAADSLLPTIPFAPPRPQPLLLPRPQASSCLSLFLRTYSSSLRPMRHCRRHISEDQDVTQKVDGDLGRQSGRPTPLASDSEDK